MFRQRNRFWDNIFFWLVRKLHGPEEEQRLRNQIRVRLYGKPAKGRWYRV